MKRPIAPKPARSLPKMESRSKVMPDAGDEGMARSRPSHSTKRGALASPNTSDLSTLASTCKVMCQVLAQCSTVCS